MTQLQRSILSISSALVILLAVLILRTSDDQGERVRVVDDDTKFNPSVACEKAISLASDFPERGMGSEGAKAAAEWIEEEMLLMGLVTEQQEFSAWVGGERVTGRNIIGIDRGMGAGEIVLLAHYDIPYHVREGAMDDASGVGALLELARIFSHKKQKKTLVFIASDGEEWGMLGARHFVKEYPDRKQIRAAISLDYVRLEHPGTIHLRGPGQFRGYAPLWLWMLAEDCVSEAGGDPKSPSAFNNFVTRAVNISGTDQGPFVAAGIPGINFGGKRSESKLARKVYHTTMDTSENLHPTLFEVYGRAVELMVRSLDALDYSTDNNSLYLRTGRQTYVGRTGVRALQLLLFAPLLLATGFQYYNLRTRKYLLREALLELGNILLFLLPWAVALVALYLLVWKNVIPRYELYPATPLDPFLKTPNWNAIIVLSFVFGLSWVAVALVRHYNESLKSLDFRLSKAVCLDTLLTLAVIALFINGFAAMLFLAPAALLWVWIEQGRTPLRLTINIALLSAAAIPLVMLTVTFSKSLMLGPHVLWYYLLAAGYRFFSPITVLIAIEAVTVGVRLFQKSLDENGQLERVEMESD